jgi:hypothetical protein
VESESGAHAKVAKSFRQFAAKAVSRSNAWGILFKFMKQCMRYVVQVHEAMHEVCLNMFQIHCNEIANALTDSDANNLSTRGLN